MQKLKAISYVFLFFVFSSLSVLAQIRLPTNELGQVQYQEIVRVPDSKRPARQLMEQARSWAAQQYDLNLATEQQYDQENNILFIKSTYPVNTQVVRYTLTIEPKFGRYRVTLTDLITEANGLNVPIQASNATVDEIKRAASSSTKPGVIEQTAQQQKALYQDLDKACRDTLASLKEAMSAP